MRIRTTNPNPTIGDQNEIRENTMMMHNNQSKALFPLSLDGRGVRGEGVPFPVGAVSTAIGRIAAKAAPTALLAALFLAPSAALADNECVPVGVDPSANLGLADSYDCDESSNSNDYPDGVTYTADGDLTVNFTGGGIAEVLDAGVDLGGINLSATGTDSIIFDSLTVETEIESEAVTGALLNVTTADGDIDIDTGQMDADGQTPQGVTHAIRAESTGSGSIDINTTGNVDASSSSNPPDSIGIEAITDSGGIDLTTGGDVRGNRYGIRAVAGGAGDIDITASDSVSGDMAGLDATTGTGDLTVDLVDGAGTFSGDINVIRADVGGDIEINIGTGRRLRSPFDSTGMLHLTAAGTTTVNNAGTIATNDNRGTLIIRAAGGALVLNNDGVMEGTIDTALNDGYIFNNDAGAIWELKGIPETPNTRRFNTPGVGPKVSELGAGTLNNAGTIDLGISSIQADGTAYTGSGDSLLGVRVHLDGTSKTSCADIDLGACLDLSGGSTAGQTAILVNARFTSLVTGPLTALSSANPGIVLIDVSGGDSSADHFVLDPGATIFDEAGAEGGGGETVSVYATDPIYGAVLDLDSVLHYALLYNPDTQQHVLASVPATEGVEYFTFVDQALSLWHTTTGAVVDRQAELRDRATGKVWFRAVGERSSRDAAPTFTTQGNTFTYDRGYSLDSAGGIVGFDMTAGDDHAAGVHIGLVSASLEYDHSSTVDETEGATFGAYGGWWNDSGISLDAAVNFNALSLNHNVKDIENTDTGILSFGWRMEAGWRLALSEVLYLQPLATVAYVKSDIDDVELEDNTLGFEDEESLRSAIGARVGADTALPDDSRIGFWLTARAWEEHRGDGRVEFAVQQGDPLAIRDDLSGSFDEIGLGASFTSPGESLSVYFSGNRKSADQFNSYDISLGARFHW